MSKDTKNFKVSEFTCKCGCGANKTDQRIIDMAQKIRDEVNAPVRVNSGYRCDKHNIREGGVKGSFHTKGLAADLSSDVGAQALFEAVQKLWNEGKLNDMKYCIYYARKNFIHIDCGRDRKNHFEVKV